MVCLVAALLVTPPPPPTSDSIEPLTHASFKNRVLRPQLPADKKKLWVVFFYADWCEKCPRLQPLFVELAGKFSHARRQFASVDVARHEEVAREMGIDVSGFTKQLPTMAVFYNGLELRRMPAALPNKPGKFAGTSFEREGVLSHFWLDQSPLTIIKGLTKGTKEQ